MMFRHKTLGFALGVLAGGLALNTGPALGQPSWVVEPIVRTGDAIPGAAGSVFGNVFGRGIDSTGGVSFAAVSAASSAQGCFYGTPGQIGTVLMAGQPAVGLPASPTINLVGGCLLGLNGAITAWANAGAFPQDVGALFLGDASGVEPVLYHAGPAPGIPPAVVSYQGPLPLALVNAAGQTALQFAMNDPTMPNGVSNSTAIVTGTPDDWSVVARTTFPVEPIPGAAYTGFTISGGTAFNDAGQIGFKAWFTGPSIAPGTGVGYFLRSPGEGTSLVARPGDPAPTFGPGVTFAALGNLVIGLSDTGKLRFTATVEGPGIDPSNASGLWAGAPGNIAPVLMQGDNTLGLEPGVEVESHLLSTINNLDWIAVEGSVGGPGVSESNDQALWLGPLDAPEVVLREGDPAPGLDAGVVFAFGEDSTADLVHPRFELNDNNDLLVLVELAGPGVTPENDVGLWFRDGQSSEWSLLLRTGDVFDGAVIAPYGGLALPGISPVFDGDMGLTQVLLEDGTFVASLHFTDGTAGVYRFTVPEPNSAIVLLATGWILVGKARRREKNAP